MVKENPQCPAWADLWGMCLGCTRPVGSLLVGRCHYSESHTQKRKKQCQFSIWICMWMYVSIYVHMCFWFRIKSCFPISNFPRSLWLLAFNILYCCAAMVQWRPAVWTWTGSARCQRQVLCSHPAMLRKRWAKHLETNSYGFFQATWDIRHHGHPWVYTFDISEVLAELFNFHSKNGILDDLRHPRWS